MRTIFRDPIIEEGVHNIVLQNRCGNRMTLLVHDDRTDLEFVYKPNACRRKDFGARNFSNRDIYTELFGAAALPDIGAASVARFDYDPFVTRLHILTPAGARNTITVVNIADQNCFALAADRPLVITFSARGSFRLLDGLLLDEFSDRGETICTFVSFESFEANRFRMLDEGRAVLQLMDNDVALIGGEEAEQHVTRALRACRGRSLGELIAHTEACIAPVLSKGRVEVRDPKLQAVLDLNRRIVYSGIDEGGACFGALNRIYHLIWVRDGAMTTALMARAGNPDLLRLWTPFLLRNPSHVRLPNGMVVPEFLQMLGTRWTKAEDDGLFYAALTCFTHWQTTGDDALLHGPEFSLLLDAIDRALDKTFDAARGLVGSDTLGETSLTGSPLYGYDAVNGRMAVAALHDVEKTDIQRSYSLYHQVNMFNVLTMAQILLTQRPELGGARPERYADIAATLREGICTKFVNKAGVLSSMLAVYTTGRTKWIPFEDGDYWETAWACSLGPFFPALELQLRTARMIKTLWPGIRAYGYCPWNTLSRFLREFGMSTTEYRAMLADEITEASTTSVKYPLTGALTEYWRNVEGWRGLPFSTGSLLFSVAGQLLQSLPLGLAVRAGMLVDSIDDFCYRTARINAVATGTGDAVATWTLNGEEMPWTLQVPEQRLRTGRNLIEVTRGPAPQEPRLIGSSAALRTVTGTRDTITYALTSAVPSDLLFAGVAPDALRCTDATGAAVPLQCRLIEQNGVLLVHVSACGDFTVKLRRR